MALNIERFKKDLEDLKERGQLLELTMVRDVHGKEKIMEIFGNISEEKYEKIAAKFPKFRSGYEAWYSECLSVLKQLLPDRRDAFIRHYERPRVRVRVEKG